MSYSKLAKLNLKYLTAKPKKNNHDIQEIVDDINTCRQQLGLNPWIPDCLKSPEEIRQQAQEEYTKLIREVGNFATSR
jgi:hypothetical protein